MARERDYKAEYRRRVERGLARGKTRQAARGHARGEGRAVRKRPTTREEREAARQRGAIARAHAEALSREKKDPKGGIRGASAFKLSLRNPRHHAKTGTVVFTFEGTPKEGEISPKLDAQASDSDSRRAYQAVPMRYDAKRPPRSLGSVFLDLDTEIAKAARKTSLEEPRLVDLYVVKRTVRDV